LLGAAWFATRLKYVRALIRPIYVDMGILPPEIQPIMEDASGS
jgi:hypothetical protein